MLFVASMKFSEPEAQSSLNVDSFSDEACWWILADVAIANGRFAEIGRVEVLEARRAPGPNAASATGRVQLLQACGDGTSARARRRRDSLG